MRIFSLNLAVPVVLVIALSGCGGDSSSTSTSSGPETEAPPNTIDPHAGHAHPSEGPHHGELIELGNEEYHAELLHEGDSITIYILDGSATKQVPIEATEITINAKHDGQPEQFKLMAKPDEGDEDGKSSRFVSTDSELSSHLDEEGADPRLVLTINGKGYRGNISHKHDHDHSH